MDNGAVNALTALPIAPRGALTLPALQHHIHCLPRRGHLPQHGHDAAAFTHHRLPRLRHHVTARAFAVVA